MTTIIFITAEEIGTIDGNLYDYSGQDRILKNIFSGDFEVFYSGQNQGRMDYQLIDAVNSLSTFRIYFTRPDSVDLGFSIKSSYLTIYIGILDYSHFS